MLSELVIDWHAACRAINDLEFDEGRSLLRYATDNGEVLGAVKSAPHARLSGEDTKYGRLCEVATTGDREPYIASTACG